MAPGEQGQVIGRQRQAIENAQHVAGTTPGVHSCHTQLHCAAAPGNGNKGKGEGKSKLAADEQGRVGLNPQAPGPAPGRMPNQTVQ